MPSQLSRKNVIQRANQATDFANKQWTGIGAYVMKVAQEKQSLFPVRSFWQRIYLGGYSGVGAVCKKQSDDLLLANLCCHVQRREWIL